MVPTCVVVCPVLFGALVLCLFCHDFISLREERDSCLASRLAICSVCVCSCLVALSLNFRRFLITKLPERFDWCFNICQIKACVLFLYLNWLQIGYKRIIKATDTHLKPG